MNDKVTEILSTLFIYKKDISAWDKAEVELLELMSYQVEQQTKQLREERNRATDLLKQILQEDGNRRFLYSAERSIINDFLNQSSHKNEG